MFLLDLSSDEGSIPSASTMYRRAGREVGPTSFPAVPPEPNARREILVSPRVHGLVLRGAEILGAGAERGGLPAPAVAIEESGVALEALR